MIFTQNNPYAPPQQPDPQQGYSPNNPYAPGYTPNNPYIQQPDVTPPDALEQSAGILGSIRHAGSQLTELLSTNPLQTAKGIAKGAYVDLLRATGSAPMTTDPRLMLAGETPVTIPPMYPEFIRRHLPKEATDTITQGEQLRSGFNTAVNLAGLPFLGHTVGGGLIGAINEPADPLAGFIVGATLGKTAELGGRVVGAVGKKMGLARAEGTSAPPANAATTVPSAPNATTPPPPSGPRPMRDLTNAEVLDMTPEGVRIAAKQAATEEKNLYSELFGPKPARKYRAAANRLDSGTSSPEQAAKDQTLVDRMRAQLTPEQTDALDKVHTEGFTADRLKNIHDKIKDYTPENLAQFDDTSLIRQFGEVLMTKNPNRNLSGMYRFRALLGEARSRGISDADMLRGVYDYMRGEGIPADGLAEKIMGQLIETRKTLGKVMPTAVTPPEAVTPSPTATTVPAAAAPTVAPPTAAPAVPPKAAAALGPEMLAKSLADKLVANPDQLAKIYSENKAVSETAKGQGKSAAYADAFLAYVDRTYPGIGKLAEQGPAAQVAPETPQAPSELAAPTRENLGPVSEEQFQAELAGMTPRAAPPGAAEEAARARVEAARTTPFPGAKVPEVKGAGLAALLPDNGSTVGVMKNLRDRGLVPHWERLTKEWKAQSGEPDHIVAEASARRILDDYDRLTSQGFSDRDAKRSIEYSTQQMESDPNVERIAAPPPEVIPERITPQATPPGEVAGSITPGVEPTVSEGTRAGVHDYVRSQLWDNWTPEQRKAVFGATDIAARKSWAELTPEEIQNLKDRGAQTRAKLDKMTPEERAVARKEAGLPPAPETPVTPIKGPRG